MVAAQDEARAALEGGLLGAVQPRATTPPTPTTNPVNTEFGAYRALLNELTRATSSLALKAQVVEAHRLKANQYAVEYHKKFAIPVACIVFVLLGVPLGVSTGRGGRGVSVGVSLAAFLVYYLFLTGGEKLADRGRLAPWLSMWAANFVLGGLGIYMLASSVRETKTLRVHLPARLRLKMARKSA